MKSHGHTKNRTTTREFNSWLGMRQRCTYPKHHRYPRYGGRGITVCDRWLNSFENFLADMGARPTGTTLDRIDNDGNYEPGNCRWATPSEQAKTRTKPTRRKSHCPSGHPYEGANLLITRSGDRKCRACGRIRAAAKRRTLAASRALAVTKQGHPAHPLYLRADLTPAPYAGPRTA